MKEKDELARPNVKTKSGRHWLSNAHHRRKRSDRPCARATCKKLALVNSEYCAMHTDALEAAARFERVSEISRKILSRKILSVTQDT